MRALGAGSKEAEGRLALPERVLQFGEGNFLRAFVDWMIHGMNRRGLFGGSVVVVQPIRKGLVEVLNGQDGLYTVILRGIENGKIVDRKEVVSSISRGIDPYARWGEFLACASNPDLRFVVSNTTEAGIAWVEEKKPEGSCPESFPAKLAAFLHARYEAFGGDPGKGMIIIPCELIEGNGDALRETVIRHAKSWGSGEGFLRWLEGANAFLNSLVDRIVTGYPADEAEALGAELGYRDALMDSGEIFHLWVIEGSERLEAELPLKKAGFNVVWTGDLKPYRDRKVRILNGAHTMTALMAFLCGKDTVGECVSDPLIRAYMERGIFGEIAPTLKLPPAEKEAFARAVLERFSNPFIKHRLLSIALNSVSKFKVRVLPSLLEGADGGKVPETLAFSLASLIAFYRGCSGGDGTYRGARDAIHYEIYDDEEALKVFEGAWTRYGSDLDLGALCRTVLSSEALWGRDLLAVRGLERIVEKRLGDVLSMGMRGALEAFMKEAGA
jgi:tagaturonate reductase